MAAGTVSGRRLTIGGRDGVAVLASGAADHLALVASASGEVLVVTALAEALELDAGDVVSIRGFSDEIADPV